MVIVVRLALCLLVIGLTAEPASADQRGNALAIQCLEEVNFFSLQSITYDGRGTPPASGPNLFVNREGGWKQAGRVPVASCRLGERTISVERIWLNIPDATGICGGADYAQFRLSVDGVSAAAFYAGCSSLWLRATEDGYFLCGPAVDVSCEIFYSWSDIDKPGFEPVWRGAWK